MELKKHVLPRFSSPRVGSSRLGSHGYKGGPDPVGSLAPAPPPLAEKLDVTVDNNRDVLNEEGAPLQVTGEIIDLLIEPFLRPTVVADISKASTSCCCWGCCFCF